MGNEPEGNGSKSRLRFGLAAQLWITTWTALWLGCWAIFGNITNLPLNHGTADAVLICLYFALLALPYAAFGALVGRMWLGLAFGLLVAAISTACIGLLGPVFW